MTRTHIATALLACVLASAKDFSGTYEFVPSASDNIEAAIKDATSSMSFIVKPVARSRLKKVNQPRPRLFVHQSADTISIAYDEKFPQVAPLDGHTVKWKNEEGEQFDLSIEHTEETLTQRFVAPDGERLNEFRQSAAGDTLYLSVTIKSPRLKQPLRYRLVYHRKD
jgi:hypothetical protein